MQIGTLIKTKNVLVQFFTEKLTPKLSYKLMKFISKIETEEKFFNEKMREIIDKYGEKDEKGKLIPMDNGIKLKDGTAFECNKEIAELESIEVEAPNITFTLDELSEIKLSVQDMFLLSEFIIENQ